MFLNLLLETGTTDYFIYKRWFIALSTIFNYSFIVEANCKSSEQSNSGSHTDLTYLAVKLNNMKKAIHLALICIKIIATKDRSFRFDEPILTLYPQQNNSQIKAASVKENYFYY